jgi:hypothetical protein
MGTKKGQKRKTARRAYVKKKPTTKRKTTKRKGPKKSIMSNGKRFTLSPVKYRSKSSARKAGKGKYFRVRGTRLYTRKSR